MFLTNVDKKLLCSMCFTLSETMKNVNDLYIAHKWEKVFDWKNVVKLKLFDFNFCCFQINKFRIVLNEKEAFDSSYVNIIIQLNVILTQ